MNKDAVIRKLTSRKFFTMLAGQATMILTLMNVGDNTIAKVVAIIGGFSTMVAYIFSEAWVDAKSLEGTPTEVITEETTGGSNQ